MEINIIGDGSFGTFLKELLPTVGFTLSNSAHVIVLAVPISAYEGIALDLPDNHFINVCSVQKPSTEILLGVTHRVTSIHPLFGRRTPEVKRNSILTHESQMPFELQFLHDFERASNIIKHDNNNCLFTTESHDKMMARTHKKAVQAAQLIKPFVTDTNDIPDVMIPNSFRLLRDFVKTLDDMPQGTLESIMANPFD